MDVNKVATELRSTMSPTERSLLAHALLASEPGDAFTLTESPSAILDRASVALAEIHAAEEARTGKSLRPEQAREVLRRKDVKLYDAMVEASTAWTRA